MCYICAVEFHGVWENLVYDTDIKEKVSWPAAVYDVTDLTFSAPQLC